MRFCNKCGKQIETGIICPECAIKEYEKEHFQGASFSAEAAPSAPESQQFNPFPEPRNRMYGFGKALTAVILSVVAFFISYFALLFSMFMDSVGAALIMISLALSVISLLLGIRSIKLFIERKATCVKPIPTLILGISALPFSGISILYVLLSFILISVI